MKGNIKGRLAKLEASVNEPNEEPVFLFASTGRGESRQDFENRCEQLKREAGYPNRPIVFFQWITKAGA